MTEHEAKSHMTLQGACGLVGAAQPDKDHPGSLLASESAACKTPSLSWAKVAPAGLSHGTVRPRMPVIHRSLTQEQCFTFDSAAPQPCNAMQPKTRLLQGAAAAWCCCMAASQGSACAEAAISKQSVTCLWGGADASGVHARAHLAGDAHSSGMPPGGQHDGLLDQDALLSGASRRVQVHGREHG